MTIGLVSILAGSALAGPDLTTKHEKGRCAIRGQCGKQSFFGSELPCPDNGLAKTPDDAVRKKLGLALQSQRINSERIYRIAADKPSNAKFKPKDVDRPAA